VSKVYSTAFNTDEKSREYKTEQCHKLRLITWGRIRCGAKCRKDTIERENPKSLAHLKVVNVRNAQVYVCRHITTVQTTRHYRLNEKMGNLFCITTPNAANTPRYERGTGLLSR
jgi:hypothetical protein